MKDKIIQKWNALSITKKNAIVAIGVIIVLAIIF